VDIETELHLEPHEVRAITERANNQYSYLEWKEAFLLYKQVQHLCTTGHVNYRLGVMHDLGFYTAVNKAKAEVHFRKALDQLMDSVALGDSEACCDLGYMYDCGYLVIRDPELAFKYYKIAADKGLHRAQFNLGLLYDEGVGTPVDVEKSMHYFQLAVNQGYINALCHLADLHRNGYKNIIPKDINTSIKYCKQAADSGYSPAYLQLGDLYSKGTGVFRDYKLATKYYIMFSQKNDVKHPATSLFTNSSDKIRREATTYLAETWPDSHGMLNVRCRKGLMALFMTRKEFAVILPVELIMLIAVEMIIAWPATPDRPDYHYV